MKRNRIWISGIFVQRLCFQRYAFAEAVSQKDWGYVRNFTDPLYTIKPLKILAFNTNSSISRVSINCRRWESNPQGIATTRT